MDDEDFNDFESAPPLEQPQAPPHPRPASSTHSHPASTPVDELDLLEQAALQPQFSLIANGSQAETPEVESGVTEESPQPDLNKKGSDHLGGFLHMQSDFMRTYSLNEDNRSHNPLQSNPQHGFLHFKRTGPGHMQPHPTSPLITESAEATHPHDSNARPQQDDKNEEKATQISYKTANVREDLLCKSEQIEEEHDQPQQSVFPESRKESEQFVFQQAEARRQSEQFVFLSRQQYQYQQSQPRKESDEFGVFSAAEARKQSDDFVYQSSEPEVPNQPGEAPLDAQIQQPTQTTSEQIVSLGQQVNIQIDTDFFSYRNAEPTQNISFPSQEESVTGEEGDKEKFQERAGQKTEYLVQEKAKEEAKEETQFEAQVEAQVEEDDEDEFGEFQETVAGSQVEESIQYQGQVRVQEDRVPYGQDIPLKEAQLREFVAALPDYSFLLAEAFLQCQ